MSAVPGTRAPGPGRIVGAAILFGAAGWALALLASWPWQASAPDAAVLRVSLRHVSGFSEAARARSAEELARLPAHMRPKDGAAPVTGRRSDATLEVRLDGRPVLSRTYRPTGLRRDGPIYAYEEIPVPPGRHALSIVLADPGAGDRRWPIERDVEIRAGRVALAEFGAETGWRLTE